MGIDYASAAKGDDLSITWAGQLPALIAGRVVEHLQRPVASESEFKVTVKVEERCGHLARSHYVLYLFLGVDELSYAERMAIIPEADENLLL